MNVLESVKSFLGGRLERTEALIASALQSDIRLLDETNRALLSHSGKGVRPILSLLSAGATGVFTGDSVRFAAATELLHNATLLHDDVVDGSATRRGRPTVMSLLGGPASVLIGDYWLVKCIECVLSADRYSETVVRLFARTLSDLAEGEMLQLQKATECDTTEADYLRIIHCKTASLFRAGCRAGAISAGAPETLAEAVSEYGRLLGLAFQIQDDILDYEGGAALGKPTGQDLKEQKITLPLLCVLEGMPSGEAAALRRRVAALSDRPEGAGEILSLVLERGGVDQARARLEKFIDSAVSCLAPLPDSPEKSYLAKLARYVGAREN